MKPTADDVPALQTDALGRDEVAEVEEVAFRLFAPSSTQVDGGAAKVIRIRSLTPENEEAGLVDPHRDRRYYFVGQRTPGEVQQYALAAVSGEEVLARSRSYWPGSVYPWKIIHIRAAQAKSAFRADNTSMNIMLAEDSTRRRRLGKKGRIRKRQKYAKREARAKEQSVVLAEKERLAREKKARRNREKKFKKRARDKTKKSGLEGERGDDPDRGRSPSEDSSLAVAG